MFTTLPEGAAYSPASVIWTTWRPYSQRPGYLGLEWLKKTEGTRLKGLEISSDMIVLAKNNAAEYGLSERVEYYQGDAKKMPFEDGHFDAVFSNGSLHEWQHPEMIFNEIARVLKTGGRYLISDLRRDMIAPARWFLWLTVKPREMRPGLITSINASYTLPEIKAILARTELKGWQVSQNPLGIVIYSYIIIYLLVYPNSC